MERNGMSEGDGEKQKTGNNHSFISKGDIISYSGKGHVIRIPSENP
jgi:hypothetical protein